MKPLFIPTVLFSFLVTLAPHRSTAQPVRQVLPFSTLVQHYVLSVAYSTTTVLVFPATVKPVDRGDRDIIAQKQSGADNVLKIKAAQKNFAPTNLHVFTADGRIYAFDVFYTDSLASTHDLTRLTIPPDATALTGPVLLTDQPVNSAELQAYIREMDSNAHPHRGPSDHTGQMTLRLDQAGLAGPLVFFRLHFSNRSNLDYHLDFIRLFLRDREKAKRTSVQEREMIPVYEDSLPVIRGHGDVRHLLAIPAFTLSNGKQFVLEAYEKNGGRTLTLYIRNKTLFRAKPL